MTVNFNRFIFNLNGRITDAISTRDLHQIDGNDRDYAYCQTFDQTKTEIRYFGNLAFAYFKQYFDA